MDTPIIAVLLPVSKKDCIDAKKLNELQFQGNLTIKNRTKYHSNNIVKKHCYFLNDDKYSLGEIKEKLSLSGSILYIVGHHEIFGQIGMLQSFGITPEDLASNLSIELGCHIKKIKKIIFFVCNSMYHSESTSKSYCGRFHKCMLEYGNTDVQIGGFNGFLFEDPIKKRTYLSPVYGEYDKLKRADDNIIWITNKKNENVNWLNTYIEQRLLYYL